MEKEFAIFKKTKKNTPIAIRNSNWNLCLVIFVGWGHNCSRHTWNIHSPSGNYLKFQISRNAENILRRSCWKMKACTIMLRKGKGLYLSTSRNFIDCNVIWHNDWTFETSIRVHTFEILQPFATFVFGLVQKNQDHLQRQDTRETHHENSGTFLVRFVPNQERTRAQPWKIGRCSFR